MSFQDTILYQPQFIPLLAFQLYLHSSIVTIREVSHHTAHCLSLIILGDLSYRCVVIFCSVLWEKPKKNVESVS